MEPHIPAPAEPPTEAPLLHLARGHAPLKPSLKAGLPSRVILDAPDALRASREALSQLPYSHYSPHFLKRSVVMGNRVRGPRADSKCSAELRRAQPGRKAPSPRRSFLLRYLTGCRKWQDKKHKQVPHTHSTPEGPGRPPAPSPDSLEGNGAWHSRTPGPPQRAIHRPHLVLPAARSWWAPLTARTGALYEQCNHMGAQAPAFRSGKRCAASSLSPPPHPRLFRFQGSRGSQA